MNILSEILELNQLFSLFSDYIIEYKFIYKNLSYRNLVVIWFTDYHFTLISEQNFDLFSKKFSRIKTIIKNKENYIDESNKKIVMSI